MDKQILIQEINRKFSYDPGTGVVTCNSAWGKLPAGRPLKSKVNGYIVASINHLPVPAHRIAWVLTHGELPEVIDHINGVRDDNRLCNLRNTSQRVNMQNQRKASSYNKTGFLGVTYNKQTGRYRAQIGNNGKIIHLGAFDTPESAHAAYLQAKRQLHEGCTI
jgi:hypothetical protein